MTNLVVVDDDLSNVQLTKMLLELEGFTVEACMTLSQANLASTEDIEGFVVDVNLARNESGLDLVRAVRAGDTGAAVDAAIIVTSGDPRRESEAEAAGANHFLLKPYAPEAMSTILMQLLQGRAND